MLARRLYMTVVDEPADGVVARPRGMKPPGLAHPLPLLTSSSHSAGEPSEADTKEGAITRIRSMEKAHSIESTGLCTTGNHSRTCTFPRRGDRQVMFCEGFDDHQDNPFIAGVRVRASLSAISARSPEADRSSRFTGLCMICEHRESCTFPGSKGGVWHCEELV